MGVLIDRFMELDIHDSIKVYEIFGKVSKQLDKLDPFYGWLLVYIAGLGWFSIESYRWLSLI